MKIINFSINRKLKVNTKNTPSFFFNKSDTKLYILGELIGAIMDDKIFDNENLKIFLKENIFNTDLLKKIARNSIGSFYLIIIKKNNVDIFCSYTSPGLFYSKRNNNIYFSSSERSIFKTFGKLSKIDEKILLNTVKSHQILLRLPFTTFFKNISRLPGGTGLIIDEDLNIDLDIQIANEIPSLNYKELSEKKNKEKFKFLLENTLKLIVEYYDGNIGLLFSGGIDSSVIMTALKKKGLKFFATYNAYNGVNSQDTIIAKKIAKKLNVKLHVQKKFEKPDLKSLINISTSGLGTNVTPYQLTINVRPENFGYKNRLNLLSGQNLDTLYHVDAFAPGSSSFFPLKILHIIYFLRHRIMYSNIYLKNKKNWFLKLWPFSIGRKKHSFDLKEYISSICIPIYEHTIPLKEKLNKNDKGIDRIIKRIRYDKLFVPVYKFFMRGKFKTLFRKSNSLQKISLIKVFRWMRTVNNVPLNYYNLSIETNLNRHIPFTDGPIANFFLKKSLSITEMFFIKKMMYQYFKDEVGISYFHFCKNNSFITYISFIRFIIKKVLTKFNIIKANNHLKPQINFSKELKILNKMRFSKKNILVEIVNDKNIKILFKNYYKILDNPKKNISRDEMMAVCRFVNIENNLYKIK